MRIKWKMFIAGQVEGKYDGVKPGDIQEVPDVAGARYCARGMAEPVVEKHEEHAVAPAGEVRVHEVAASDELPGLHKRGPGRPPKVAD